MSGQLDEVEALRKEVGELKDRIAELEEAIDGAGSAHSDVFDRYDSYVMERVESVSDAHPRTLMRLYKERGVVDKQKQKRRAKRLKSIKTDQE